MKRTTLCYIEKDDRYLMLYRNKKENDCCEGKWVGIGGKFEPGEGPEDCLLREVREETGLKLTDYTFHGIVHFMSNEVDDEDMYLYSASGFTGELIECNEGELSWIPKEDVVSLNLWEGDKYFLEKLMAGERGIDMTCVYDGDHLAQVYESPSTFAGRVYEAVKRIPYGRVASYGEVAIMAGYPGAARAVGNALHVNPYDGIVPCHRVVNAKGRLAPLFCFGGPEEQAKRLEAEGIRVKDGYVDLSEYSI